MNDPIPANGDAAPQPAPGARLLPMRNFIAEIRFAHGAVAKIKVEARDIVAATAKMAGLISDQSAKVDGLHLEAMNESRIIVARGVMPPGKG